MTEPTPLVAIPRPADPDVVSLAESLLAKAKAGELTALVYAASDEAGRTTQGYAGYIWTARIVGSIEMLKCQLLIEQRERDG